MDWLQTACNIIILVGGTCVAIKNIFEWFGKPIKIFKKKNQQSLDDTVVNIIKRELPAMIDKHLEVACKNCKMSKTADINNIKGAVLEDLADELKQISLLTIQYETLVISAKDVLREKIMGIYHKNQRDRKLSYYESRALKQYYKDYKAIKGNSYIDEYYERMMTWAVEDDDYII